jgi:hypothetical protein
MGKILFPKYFPTCPKDGSDYVVPGYTAALTATLAQTMKLFWRPRKIKVSGSYNKFLDTGYIRDCVEPADFEVIIKSPYGSEEEMVCDPAKDWKLESSTNVQDFEFGSSWGTAPLFYGGQDSLYTFNSFEFIMDTGDQPGGGGCFYKVLIKQLYPVEREETGPFDYKTINIAGVDFNMATYFNNDFQAGYVTASVEVTEWWSFGGTYNTATGEPL